MGRKLRNDAIWKVQQKFPEIFDGRRYLKRKPNNFQTNCNCYCRKFVTVAIRLQGEKQKLGRKTGVVTSLSSELATSAPPPTLMSEIAIVKMEQRRSTPPSPVASAFAALYPPSAVSAAAIILPHITTTNGIPTINHPTISIEARKKQNAAIEPKSQGIRNLGAEWAVMRANHARENAEFSGKIQKEKERLEEIKSEWREYENAWKKHQKYMQHLEAEEGNGGV